MADRPPRYGEDTWYGVVGYEGDPHILAYRREHPEHITVPLRWKVPPSRDDHRQPAARRPARPGERAERARPLTLPRPGEMLSVAELKAIMAQARGEPAPGGVADDLLIPVQSGRGPRGGRPSGPAGARRDWTPLELWNQQRIDKARARLAEIEPRNPLLQTIEPAGTPPTPAMADAMEAELIAARGRESRGEPGRYGTNPQVPGENTRDGSQTRVDPREKPGVATFTLLPRVDGQWLRGTHRNLGLVPSQVAERLNGRRFASWREFREAFWREVANTPQLARQFDEQDVVRMASGRAPFVDPEQRFGGRVTYDLHHRFPIRHGGGVYDMNNLVVVTPRMHQSILDPSYHYGAPVR